MRSRSRLRNTRFGGTERSSVPTVAFSTWVRSTSATSSTNRRISDLALASATPDRLSLSRSSCSISDMLGVSCAASSGSASTSRRCIRLTRSASMAPSSGPIAGISRLRSGVRRCRPPARPPAAQRRRARQPSAALQPARVGLPARQLPGGDRRRSRWRRR